MASGTIAYVAVSLDGYIAGDGGSVAFLEKYGTDEYDFHGFYDSIGAIVLGATTYEQVLGWGWPYGDLPGLILTNRDLATAEGASLTFSSGPTGDAIREFSSITQKKVWIVGGGRVIVDAINAGVVDELEMYVMPDVLGGGVPLFPDPITASLELAEAKPFSNGVVMLRYGVEGPRPEPT